jgi:5-methylcytosine-specific restriction endonuclease McrA
VWKHKRSLRLQLNHRLFNGYCEMCFSVPARHVHHMTYSRQGNEWIFDLAAICEECHRQLHPDME